MLSHDVSPTPLALAPAPARASDPAADRHRAAVRGRLDASGMGRPGPGSVSWRINREIVVVAGWGRAILLQIAHPLVAAGVHDHSHFRASPIARLARLRSTIDAMRSLTFGDDEAAIAAAARINAIHDRVFGRLPTAAGPFPAGAMYSAHAADLLAWVHATLLDSILRTHELLVGPLTPGDRDRYCREAAVMEPLLGIPPGRLPRHAAALEAHVDAVVGSGTLAVTDLSRTLARAVLFPPGWRLLWPVFRPVQLLTIGLLPPAVREAYGFGWTTRDARALARWAAASRRVRGCAPARLREWAAARRRAADDPV